MISSMLLPAGIGVQIIEHLGHGMLVPDKALFRIVQNVGITGSSCFFISVNCRDHTMWHPGVHSRQQAVVNAYPRAKKL